MPDLLSLTDVTADLATEGDDLDRLVAGLGEPTWATPTPAEGWTVRDSVVHLGRSDEAAAVAMADPERFREDLREHIVAVVRPQFDGPAGALLAWWRQGRREVVATLGDLAPDVRVAWFGPPMRARTFGIARLMETWAHGQDVADALGVARPPTARLRWVAELGVRTRGWSFTARGAQPPDHPVRVELTAPDGAVWTWGPEDAPDSVRGPALDFCLLVTQRRHRDDLDLTAAGDAEAWLHVAQAFAGPPGGGRRPGQFA